MWFGEHATELGLTCVRRLAVGLAFASLRLFLHHWYACPVHLHIQNRNRLTHDDGQIQSNDLADFVLFALGDVGANGPSVRSTDLVVTSKPARTFICARR